MKYKKIDDSLFSKLYSRFISTILLAAVKTSNWLMLIFVLICGSINGQTLELSGLVQDEQGNPLIGVTVMEKGTSNGTITAYDGTYSIHNLRAESVIEFSYVGMISKEVTRDEKTILDITLSYDFNKLDEVVVVGYGKQVAGDITGSMCVSFCTVFAGTPIRRASFTR